MGSLRAAAVLAVLLLTQVGSAGGASPPFRPTGGLVFGPAAPVDPAGTSAQPNLALGDDGTIWLSSSTIGQTVFVRRSSDDGRSFREGRELGELRTDLDDATAALLALSAANWAYTWLRPDTDTDELADRFYNLLLEGIRGYATR